jgi:hypothetical protein
MQRTGRKPFKEYTRCLTVNHSIALLGQYQRCTTLRQHIEIPYELNLLLCKNSELYSNRERERAREKKTVGRILGTIDVT